MLEGLIVCQAMESYHCVRMRCSEIHFIKSSLVITQLEKGQIYRSLNVFRIKKTVAIRKKYILRAILVVEFMEQANESKDDRVRI